MNTRSKGNVGENVSCSFLEREGFRIVTRNYQKKWGELDIVAIKDGTLHFFEVKSSTFAQKSSRNGSRGGHVPEENVHQAKIDHIRRTVRSFLAETGRPTDSEFQFHVLAVFLDLGTRKARIKWIRNVIL